MAASDQVSAVIVRGGTVVTTRSAKAADVVVRGGRIAAVVAAGTAEVSGSATIDAGGLLVFAGMVDAHVHFQEPGREEWEGFATGSAAAAAGGVTTVVDMPIDCDPPTLTAALVEAKVAALERHSRVDVAIWGGLVPASVDHLEAMAGAGVAGFKAFACPSGWDDFPAVDEVTLAAGLSVAARLNLPVAVHCELAALGHTAASEVGAVRWAAGLAAAAGARLHVVHVSAAAAVNEARRWPGVTVETCPHYLMLDSSDATRIGATALCSPPIRDAENQRRLWDLLRRSVDVIASDHSPCPPALKSAAAPWPGIDGVGMALPLLISDGRLPLSEIARLTTAAARLLRLPAKGSLLPGADADLALIDPDSRWVVGPDTTWSRHRQTPFSGQMVRARVMRTLVRGRTVFTSDDGPVGAGHGRFVRPAP
jgi:allantoinase